jgi:anthranilate phosphoribosyltransferase
MNREPEAHATGTDLSARTLDDLMAGRNLSRTESREFMNLVMSGHVPTAMLAGILTALRIKGETVPEITGFAEAMRENAVAVVSGRSKLIDTCGTGGDGSGTFNISTATALLAAAMGIPVAKHGNRAVSSRSGSADVLEALGVRIDLAPHETASLIDEVGIGFLFAPNLHPAMKYAMPARRELGIRTVFNLLGPLTNPAGADRQLLGVYSPDLCEPMCRVLAELGSDGAFVVHGDGGLDEVSPVGETQVTSLAKGEVKTFTFHPREAGISTCSIEDIQGGSPEENAKIIRAVLAGEPGPCTDAVLLNAGFAAVLAEKTDTFKAGVDLARQILADGSAAKLLDDLACRGSRTRGERT